jgi:hypothetical protein
MKVSVITPTTGAPELRHCVQSVLAQTHFDWEYHIVVDGPDRVAAVMPIIQDVGGDSRMHLTRLPVATGLGGFQGHRIYAAFSYLVSGDFLIFLDEDNWIDRNHMESLLTLASSDTVDWAYSLRKIFDRAGRFQTLDNCESLGKWPSHMSETDHLVDTNCYFLPRRTAMQVAPLWYRTASGDLANRADRTLCRQLLREYPRVETTGLYTTNYRTGNRETSVQVKHFLIGNQKMARRYGTCFPWTASTADATLP